MWGQRLGFCRCDSSFLLVVVAAKTMKVVPQADEIRCLCEKLNSPDTETLANTCTKIAKVTGPKTVAWGPSSWTPARLPAPLQSLLLSANQAVQDDCCEHLAGDIETRLSFRRAGADTMMCVFARTCVSVSALVRIQSWCMSKQHGGDTFKSFSCLTHKQHCMHSRKVK